MRLSTMDVFDYMYHDSPAGPFAESWSRDPEDYLEENQYHQIYETNLIPKLMQEPSEILT